MSTDIESILKAKLNPLVIKQERPSELAQGGPNSIKAVVRYVLSQLGEDYDAFALLQPTSPFLRTQDICDCFDILGVFDCDSVQILREISNLDHAYNQRVFENGFVKFVFPTHRKDTGRQGKPIHYAFGNLTMTRTQYFLQTGDFFGRSKGIKMPWQYGIDIDTEEDLEHAECLLKGGLI